MKIVAISDLHGNLPDIPECDILLIAGDICPHAGTQIVEKFGQQIHERVPVGGSDDMFYQSQWLRQYFKPWLETVKAKHIIATWGNHDFIGERRESLIPSELRCKFLKDSAVEIEGLKIWGSPFSLWFYDWAFNSPPVDEGGEEFLAEKYAKIPDDCDIVITHGPPLGYGDVTQDGSRTGSKALIERLRVVKPSLSVAGHIHEGYGQKTLEIGNREPMIIANVSVVNRRYQMVNAPSVFEITRRKDITE